MPKIPISDVKPSDILGGAMFAVGAAVLLGLGGVTKSTPLGVLLMILGTGAVFGRETFVKLVKELVLSTDKRDGDDETSGSEGDGRSDSDDDEADDGEVGIDRPPGEKVTPES